jgi:hypothetical protein
LGEEEEAKDESGVGLVGWRRVNRRVRAGVESGREVRCVEEAVAVAWAAGGGRGGGGWRSGRLRGECECEERPRG